MYARVARLFLGIGIIATFAGCDGDSPIAPTLPGEETTLAPLRVVANWQHPLPQGNDLSRIHGFADGTFYAVGEAGTVIRFDGTNVSLDDSPTRDDLRCVWARTSSDVLACGFNGALIHFNGATWTKLSTPTSNDLYAVWASVDNVFIAGEGGTVWRRANGSWSEYVIAPDRRFRALWGYANNDVYVSGSTGSLYHFNGTSWSAIAIFDMPVLDAEVYDLWGPAPGAISLVDRWEILWLNGTSWNGIQVINSNGLGLWGFGLNQQVAVGSGTSTHWSNGTRTWFNTATNAPLFDVWGTSMSNCYAVGKNGALERFDGSQWLPLSDGSWADLRDIDVENGPPTAVGADGQILRNTGAQWVEEPVSAGYDLAGIWQQHGLQVAVGRYAPDGFTWRQAILMNTGSGWTDVGVIGEAHQLFDVWGSYTTDIYAVGWAGEILHYDGDNWSVALASVEDAAYLNSVSGVTGNNRVFAVGRTNDLRGLIYRYDGISWSATKFKDVEELSGVWAASPTEAFAVGAFGAVCRFDGQFWRKMKSPTRKPLFCVWGSSSNDVYAGGVDGTLIHYDGTTWRELLPSSNRSINAISGSSPNDVYFAGDKGSVLFFEGLQSPN